MPLVLTKCRDIERFRRLTTPRLPPRYSRSLRIARQEARRPGLWSGAFRNRGHTGEFQRFVKQRITKFDHIAARGNVEIRNMYACWTTCTSMICTFEIWFEGTSAFTLQ